MFTEIDHVAIAVNDLEAAVKYYEDVFGATVDHREVVESDGVEEALLKVADSYVQLLTPTNDTSPVAKYLARKGEGLHHIGYRVDDCEVAHREKTPIQRGRFSSREEGRAERELRRRDHRRAAGHHPAVPGGGRHRPTRDQAAGRTRRNR